MATPEEEFSKYHDRLRHELNNANWHCEIFKYFQKVKEDYLRELNQAPAFFSLTINAHLACTLMRLNKFFDKKEPHLHIHSFLDFIEQNLDIFSNENFEKRLREKGYNERATKHHTGVTPQIVRHHQQELNNLPISSLRRWRNTILAHIEKDTVLHSVDITKKFPINQKQIENIIDTLHEILNYYSRAYDSSTWLKGIPIERGIQYTLDAIRFKLQSEFSDPAP